MVVLRYISDIHLEGLKSFPKLINKDYQNETLCLLGDIGHPSSNIYKEFIQYCSYNWKNTLVIYGNHEFWSPYDKGKHNKKYTMTEIENSITWFPDNVYFLNNSVLYIDKIDNSIFINAASRKY